MSDPLSVTAGVVGLLAASAQMIQTLYQLGSAIKDASADANAAAAELANITIVVSGLQTYVTGKVQASPQRLQLITVEHITATLTGCIVTYADLDLTLKGLHVDTGMRSWDRAKWFLKKDYVNGLTQRLQDHKATFMMMLNILQCASMSEAEQNMDRLCDTVNEILRTNQDLSMRLRNIEIAHRAGPRSNAVTKPSQDPDRGSAVSSPGASSPRASIDSTAPRTIDAPPDANNQIPKQSAFEEILHRSRVYRHVDLDSYEPSLVSDARSTLALSICSSLTLGEVSNISVYALPIYAYELPNASCYEPHEDEAGENNNEVTQTIPNQRDAARRTPPKDVGRSVRSWWKSKVNSSRNSKQRGDASTVSDPVDQHIFEVDLLTSIRYANVAISLFNDAGQSYIYGYIPIIVGKCGVFLKEKATYVEYIFEISGSPKALKELQQAFDNPPRYGKGLDWTGYTVHDAANVLLRYLLQLPDPVIPTESFEQFCKPIKEYQARAVSAFEKQDASKIASDHGTTIRAYQSMITELQPLRRQLFLYLLDLLAVFASKSDLNKMTTSKLAAIFKTAFLNQAKSTLVADDRLAQDVLIFLIENQDNFLIGMS